MSSIARNTIFLAVFGVMITGCESPYKISLSNAPLVVPETVGTPTPTPDPIHTVCDPLGGGGGTHAQGGLKASLHYMPLASQPGKFKNMDEFFTETVAMNTELFFNQVYVPTRTFSYGFANQNGDLLKNDAGETLIEYFGLKFDSILKLGPNDQAGDYQFALIADDGAVLQVDTGSGFHTIVDNDGVHPTRLACQTGVVHFDGASTRIPMKLSYYQGPRYEIALTMMWRKIADPANIPVESWCGGTGVKLFWDPSVVPSQEKQAYLDLLAHGFKVLSADNFLLTDGAQNPCNNK